MPINLRYGQQAVARGFLSKQRLDQVLAKQKQLAAQGKKVSVRMILEKAKLLDAQQLQQVDRDLNIKVVKKGTGKMQKPGAKPAVGPTGAQNFAGDAVPRFPGMSGAEPDATVFSPPPPDMQSRARQERERAKLDTRHRQEQEAPAFLDDNDSPFGNDPFGGGDMAPEPFGGEMRPEPVAEMQPEPFGGSLEPAGFGDESPFDDDPHGGFGNEPQELSRMDSSPKLASLGAEVEGFASPDDEQLPTISAFDEGPAGGFEDEPRRGGFHAPAKPAFGGPSLAPAGDDFAEFGNDIRSPEELESTPAGGTRPLGGGDLDATMFSPPPPGIGSSPRQKTGAMDRTVFSPRPPEFGGHTPMDAQPAAADDWGEEAGMEAEPFGAEPFEETPVGDDMDATVFSPPPAQMPPARGETGRQRGRQGTDDFGDVELPRGKVIDDVPTAPAAMEEVHPLRRGVGTSSSSVKRSTTKPHFEEEAAEELPGDLPEAAGFDVPDELPEEPAAAPPVGSGKGKLPGKAPLKAAGKREQPRKEEPAGATAVKEKKGAGKRVLLIFTILLLIFVAVMTLPIVLYEQVPQVRALRDHPQARTYYDYVDFEIFNRIREWTKQPVKPRPSPKPTQVIPTMPLDNSTDTPPSPEDQAEPADNTEQPPANEG